MRFALCFDDMQHPSLSAQLANGPSNRALAAMSAVNLLGVIGVASGLLAAGWALLCPALLVSAYIGVTVASHVLRKQRRA